MTVLPPPFGMDDCCPDCGCAQEKCIVCGLPGRVCLHCGLIQGAAALAPTVPEDDQEQIRPVWIYDGPYLLGFIGWLLNLVLPEPGGDDHR